MTFAATMIFYHLIGLGVATAVFLSDSRPGPAVAGFPASDRSRVLAAVRADCARGHAAWGGYGSRSVAG